MHLCFPLMAHPARAASRSKHAAPGADPAASLPNRMPRPCAIRLPRLKRRTRSHIGEIFQFRMTPS
ncbi:hypothetical protein AZ78_2145 [Lysobacter capsici AZ78]|uniref:Uncharacterized protein n=1 Tax=Lysobacter capsici AZ78 TaxID=1444315 RepID=A0A120AGH8_9GAMM|nr:hypothetical protein AZ78_2145 [Lysobacter capsici AZ78]